MLIADIKSPSKLYLNQNNEPMDLPNAREEFVKQFVAAKQKKVLYIHTPFCRTKCKYCKWASKQMTDEDQVANHWRNTIMHQIRDLYGDLFANAIFDEVYFGGGTPTTCTANIMDETFGRIPNFDKIANKCMEASPDTLQEWHVEIFKKWDFDYLSIGIQSLDPKIMKAQGRPYMTHQQVVNISDYLHSLDIRFNFDLICYLGYGDIRDIPGFKKDLQFIMDRCVPTFITVHQEHFAKQSIEKVQCLQNAIRSCMRDSFRYWQCVNSYLSSLEAEQDATYRAEYKLASADFGYMHHLWDRYNLNLKEDYAVLSIGSTEQFPLASFVGDMILNEQENKLYPGPWDEYPEALFSDLRKFREAKHLEWQGK